jgi:hypothetical protein
MQSPLTHHDRVAELELELAHARQALEDARVEHHAAQAALRDGEESERRHTETLLQTIAEGTAATVGDAFFASLIQHLASALGVRYAYLAECIEGTMARSRAFCRGGELAQNFQYNLTGTPCLGVIEGRTCCYPENLQQFFPENEAIKRMQAEAYVGVPLLNSSGQIIGHMVVIDDKPACARCALAVGLADVRRTGRRRARTPAGG